jgi:hypothetical protein
MGYRQRWEHGFSLWLVNDFRVPRDPEVFRAEGIVGRSLLRMLDRIVGYIGVGCEIGGEINACVVRFGGFATDSGD